MTERPPEMAGGSSSRLLGALTRAAAELTRAAAATVVSVRGEETVVVAVSSVAGVAGRSVGDRLSPADEMLSFVLAGGQSLALAAGPGAAADGEAVICVPCVDADGVVGALELRRPAGGGAFPEAARTVATALAEVVAVALEEDHGQRPAPAPAQLAGELADLAAADAERYAALAWAVEALLARA